MSMEQHRYKMETMVCRYLDKTCNALYDIGIGPKSEYLSIRKEMPWIRCFGCEPDPRLAVHLDERFPGDWWNAAIHSRFDKIILNQSADQKQTTLFKTPKTVASVEVPALTLDEFDERCLRPDGILLWMDIEGSELDALVSGPGLLSSGRVHAINLEVRDEVRVEGWCTASQVESFLKQHNYKLVKTYNNQHTHWDVIYLREDLANAH